MNVIRCLHKLAKEADQITEVASGNAQVGKASDELMIVSRLTLFCVEVDI